MRKKLVNLVVKSALAGLLIGLAGVLFLQTENKIVGAVLFSIGLVSIILLGGNLFTGKVGYINSKETFLDSLIILIVNLVVAFLVGLLYRTCVGMAPAADARLLKEWYRILFDATICGMCVFLSVDLYKRTTNILTIILPVVGFILAGGEHCIAYVVYLGAGAVTPLSLLYLVIMIVGNSLGALIVRFLSQAYLTKRD
jgi:nitrite transporter NirC